MADYDTELAKLNNQASIILQQMVIGNLRGNNLPPVEIVEWFAKTLAYQLCKAEQEFKGEPQDAEILQSIAQALSDCFRIFKANKMLVAEHDLTKVLKERKLGLTLSFDATYGGLLP